jgi:hypothetical protein
MAIYLDANVLWTWHSFNEAERLAINIVGRQLGQEVLVPWVASIEAEAELRRQIDDEVMAVERAEQKLARLLDERVEVMLEPIPDVEGRLEVWRRRLEGFATILPQTEEDLLAAMRREVDGRRPARLREKGKHGAGGRDVAVWLALLRDHRERDEPGHLLSKDHKAFAASEGARLHPELATEVEELGGKPVDFYGDVAAFVQKLGKRGAPREVDLGELAELAGKAVFSGLEDSLEVPRAVWDDLDSSTRYQTTITAFTPVEVLSQRRYVQGDEAAIALNVHCKLIVDALWQARDTESPRTWSVIDELHVEGKIQVFVEEGAGRLRSAQFIGAQLKSDQTILVDSHGGLTVLAGL